MSVGGLDIPVYEPEKEEKEVLPVQADTVVKKGGNQKSYIKDTMVPKDQVTAYINPSKCVNCGTCREICPADAIEENQRIICHVCPVCTEKPGMSPQKVEAVATECSCTTACPLHLSPQGYIGLAKEGMYEEAFQLIWNKNPLPTICGSVCHHPCEDACKRGILIDNPIKIRGIKKYLSVTEDVKLPKYKRIYDENVAVIGAGPAGLTTAHYLSLMGYEVTVFEAASEAGGMLKHGIPEFRLNREYVDGDIKRLQDAGLDIRFDYRVSKYTMEKLREEYDIVVVATGTPNSKELKLPGWRLDGVMTAMSFMRQINHGLEVRRHIGQCFNFKDGEAVIIGGGSVAMDVARTALRVGASKVTVVSLESGDDVPAHPWEKAEAIEEGIQFVEGYSPIEFYSDLFPTINSVKFAKVNNFAKDENGKISFTTDENDVIEIKADWVVEAIGQTADDFWAEFRDEKDVFFVGDIASNKCSVVDAMASGREAAIRIDAGLRGREVKTDMQKQKLHLAPVMEKIFPYNRRKTMRPETPMERVDTRIEGFAEVEGVFTKEQVRQEALSCMSCGYEVVDPEKCIACGMCQKLCPKGDVITLVAKGGDK